jgi:hypothetical protein
MDLFNTKLLILKLESILSKDPKWTHRKDYQLKEIIRRKYLMPIYVRPIIKPIIQPIPVIRHQIPSNNIVVSKEALNKLLNLVEEKNKKCENVDLIPLFKILNEKINLSNKLITLSNK